jgi:ribosomal protein S18 acetylase RimI-like enzyme
MSTVICRQPNLADVSALAQIRARDWGDEDYWRERISGYLRGERHPQHALKQRVIFLAEDKGVLVGFIAGHLTRRHNFDGELQWINVLPEYQRRGIASQLFRQLAEWLSAQNADRVCVDVSPGNSSAREFYKRHGAEDLNEHWLVWPDIKRVFPHQVDP